MNLLEIKWWSQRGTAIFVTTYIGDDHYDSLDIPVLEWGFPGMALSDFVIAKGIE